MTKEAHKANDLQESCGSCKMSGKFMLRLETFQNKWHM